MRLFEYLKNMFCREKPEPINSEDEFVYKQLRQITSALSKKLVSMQNIEHNISESFVLSSSDWFARAVALEIQKIYIMKVMAIFSCICYILIVCVTHPQMSFMGKKIVC